MNYSITNLFYRQPRLLVLAIGVILVGGLSALMVLPTAEDPTLSERIGRVITRYPGADAERVETLVTEKLEETVREVEEILHVNSDSRNGISVMTIELKDSVYDTDTVWSRVRDKIADAEPSLPAGTSKPEFDEWTITAYTVIAALQWDRPDDPNLRILRRMAEDLEDTLESLPGTKEVDIYGDPDEEIRVEIDAARLASLDLTVSDVADALRQSDAKVAAGLLRSDTADYLLEVSGELQRVKDIADVPLRNNRDDALLRVGDVAQVYRAIQEPPTNLSIINGKPAVTLAIRMEDGQQIDKWTPGVHAELDRFAALLPDGVSLPVIFDQSTYVSARLQGLGQNLILGMLCVIGVIFFMMGWRAAILVGSALPLVSFMVLTIMNFIGLPLHQMSVTGLIIALGLLIDNAIVTVDETKQHLREGMSPAKAISATVRYLAAPLLGSTLTTVLAFAPIVLMPGNAGEFVGSIGLGVILAVICSFGLALTIIPALTGFFEGRLDASKHGGFLRNGIAGNVLAPAYRWSLDTIVRYPVLGILIALALPLFGFVKARELPEQFFPQGDRDQFQLDPRLPPQASLARTLDITRQAREELLKHEDIVAVHWFVGTSAPKFYYNLLGGRDGSPFYANALVQMRDAEGDTQTVNDAQDLLDRALPQAQFIARKLEQGPPFNAPIEIRLFGPDLDRLRDLGDEVRTVLANHAQVVQTEATLQDGQPKLWIDIDDEQARMAGLRNVEIAQQLAAQTEGAVGGSILETTEEMPVRVRLGNNTRSQLDRIKSTNLVARTEAATDAEPLDYIPLTALGEVKVVPELASLPRRDGARVNTIRGYVRAGALASTVLADINGTLEKQGFALSAGYRMSLGGETAERSRAISNLMASVALLVAVMITTLVLSFNSFRMAVIIGFVGILAIGLGLLSIWLFGFPFGFMAIVGTMGLVGIAVNDSIVVLAGLRSNEAARKGDALAIRKEVTKSTRHVLSTTLTTIAGFIPLLIDGGQFWPPLAVAIAGGVAGCTLIALYFVPAMFVIMSGLQKRIKETCPFTVNETERGSLPPDAEAVLA